MTRAEIQQVKQRFGIIGNTEALSRAIDVANQVADRKSTRLNSSHSSQSRMPSSA